ncbi:MAG: glycosyltransferase family 39 protein [Rhodospirillum sp.]|nr:glycosyltransferase family 39 protein [Rhodospirillum sp.]MCF8489994.1 glycosyltransferase family 39 protein [Rhodospirillum sp.]MCF8498829.1 glycosyltransferase family 39 protein [Rhodospirillum sp.]
MHRLLTGWRPHVLLTLLTALFLVPGLLSPQPNGGAEEAFIAMTRALALHQAEPVASPGAHWLGLASLHATGSLLSDALWPHRLPSALCVLLAVLILHQTGRILLNRPLALVGAALFAATLALGEAGVQAGAAAPGLAAGLALIQVLVRAYHQANGGPRLSLWQCHGFWLLLGLTLLTQGLGWPLVALALAGVLALRPKGVGRAGLGWLVPLRPFPGVLFLAALVAPWLATLPEGALAQALWPGKAFSPALLALPALAWPGWIFAYPAVKRLWAERADPANAALGAWALSGLVLAPILPAVGMAAFAWTAPLCLATAAALFAVRDGTYALFPKPASLTVVGLWAVVAALAISQLAQDPEATATIGAATAALSGVYALALVWRGLYLNAAMAGILCALVLRLGGY